MSNRESCEAIEPLLAPYGEPECADLMTADERDRVTAHLEACEPCRRAAGACLAAHQAVRTNAAELATPAPQLLSARCRALAARSSAPRRATRLAGWSAAAAATAALIFVFLMPTQAIATQLAVDHLKCAKFAAGSAHTGTPAELEGIWRNRRLQQISIPDGSPAHGLRLIGLRRCVSTAGNMAHVMYERAGAPVSLFVFGDGAGPASGSRTEIETIGHKAILWSSGAVTYVLVGRAADLSGTVSWMKDEIARRRTR